MSNKEDNILADRIGIILKYGKLTGGLVKRYFYLDNQGTMYYSEKESPIIELLKHEQFNNDKFVDIMRPHSKEILLKECTMSTIRPFLDNKQELQGKSYFEIFLKERLFKAMLIFAWKDAYINQLYEYVSRFREEEERREEEIENVLDSTTECRMFLAENSSFGGKMPDIPFRFKDKAYMESAVTRLEGRFTNQDKWNKDSIKVVNPTSDLPEYQETWVELENGSNYSGPVKNGMPHGYGKEYRLDGNLYTGNFRRGKWHGSGIITNERLDSYQGEFINGCICGI